MGDEVVGKEGDPSERAWGDQRVEVGMWQEEQSKQGGTTVGVIAPAAAAVLLTEAPGEGSQG